LNHSVEPIAPTFAFETQRLRMRPLQAGDESLFRDLYTDAETMRFIGEPYSPERIVRSFHKVLASASEWPPERVFLVILEQATGRSLGICAITKFDADMSRAEVGIMLKSDARSRGYAREGLGGLVKQAFRWFKANEIFVECSALNAVVERMVSSIGFMLCDHGEVDAGPLSRRVWSIHRSA
jgi:RimJ/RimL family protein N-acetyltransferase